MSEGVSYEQVLNRLAEERESILQRFGMEDNLRNQLMVTARMLDLAQQAPPSEVRTMVVVVLMAEIEELRGQILKLSEKN
jgi:hypothetical protein